MERVRGIGGVFLKCTGDRKALLDWYQEHLGIDVEAAWGGFVFKDPGAETEGTTWSIFAADSSYFGAAEARCMVNYKVDDLEAMLAQLRAGGVKVDDKVESSEYGSFGWAWDLEGNKLELWQPPATPPG